MHFCFPGFVVSRIIWGRSDPGLVRSVNRNRLFQGRLRFFYPQLQNCPFPNFGHSTGIKSSFWIKLFYYSKFDILTFLYSLFNPFVDAFRTLLIVIIIYQKNFRELSCFLTVLVHNECWTRGLKQWILFVHMVWGSSNSILPSQCRWQI